jgi:hypothetical protein
LVDSQVLTGKQVIEKQKAKAKQQEEFAQAAEFEARNQQTRGASRGAKGPKNHSRHDIATT